ncbi:MAG: conjugal transfer protein TraF [Psychrobium sp.]|nr:conjugal transfer protein TraF [Psychrobium sp.]
MKLFKLAPLALLCSATAFAGQGDQVGNSRYSVSTLNAHAYNGVNVASVNAHLKQSISFAFMTSIRAGIEMGEADFADDMEDLIDDLDRDDLTLDEANSLIERFDKVLADAGENGYVNLQGGLELPLSILWKREIDTISFSTRAYGNVGIKILDDKLRYNPVQQSIGTNAAGYIKVADMTEVSLAYSRLVWNNSEGDLHAGVRANLQSLGLSKQVISFENADSDDDIGDIFLDDYEDGRVTSTQLAIDMSVYWAAKNYNIGLTLSNINEPEFEYTKLGQNCADKTEQFTRDNCYVALGFSDRIALEETYIANSYATVQANYFNDEYGISLDVSYETEHNTPLGDREQWMTASVSASPDSIFVPNARLTYSNNLVGSKLSYISGELTWGWLGFGAGYALDKTTVDGDEIPRGGFINLSISNQF